LKKEQKKVKSLQEMKELVKGSLKKSYTRTALLALIDSEIIKFSNINEHSMVLRIKKRDWLRVMECVNKVKKPKVEDNGTES